MFTFFPCTDPYYTIFYQGVSATGDVHENIVLRFAHGNFDDYYNEPPRDDRFHVSSTTGRYYDQPPFEYRFKTNTPFPYHTELHINRTQFDYEGEYSIIYDYYYNLRPSFTINVNSK